MTVREQEDRIVEDYLIIHDPQERLSALASWAASMTVDVSDKVDQNLVKGCASRVWLTGRQEEGRLHFRAEAESPMVHGLVNLLCAVYEGAEAADVLATEPTLWERLGFHKMLSPTRVNGLAAVRARVKELAGTE
jgi:cysteine desulfuration protein SufE